MSAEVVSQNSILNELKNFLQFVCEEKSCCVESVLNSSLSLLNYCPSSRDAVLQFFSQLFDDYCAEYCLQNSGNGLQLGDRPVGGERVGPIISRFILAQKNSSNGNSNQNDLISVRKLSTDSRRQSMDCSEDNKSSQPTLDGPSSPTAGTSGSMESLNESKPNADQNDDWNAVMTSLDFQFIRIGESLLNLIKSEANSSFAKSITDWSLELAAKLSAKYGRFSNNVSQTDPNASLSSSYAFWMQCPAMQALTNLTISSHTIELEGLVKQMLQYSPHCDWILAHLFTTQANNTGFTAYIEQLMQSAASSPSVTCILSYLSEHNPRAIVNCSQSNIPFLLKLSTNSKPLLDLLVSEATKQFNIKALNELVVSTKGDDLNEHIIYCITNAANAFDLLKLAFDISVHSEANEELKNRTLVILSAIISHIHEFVYGSNLTLTNSPPVLDLLKNNIEGLVVHSVKTSNPSLRRLQLRILHLLCMHYGFEFVTEVFHYILSAHSHTIDYTLFRKPVSNPLLSPLMKSLKLQFGAQVHNCLSATLHLPFDKNVYFWSHLLASVEAESVCLDIDLLCSHFSDHNFESKTKIFIKYYILRLLLQTMEKFPKRIVRAQHRLCLSLVSTYFKLIKLQQNCLDSELDVYMETMVCCQKAMSNLAKSYAINQYILSRVLLELSLENSQLFNKNVNKTKFIQKDSTFAAISLMKENGSYDFGTSKSRKIPLIPGKPEIQTNSFDSEDETLVVNQQLVLDAFRCCVVDMASFAKLLVQCVSPDLLFNDMPWPDEDPRDGQLQHLRVTIERDLYISRAFDANPLLWDLCELISSAGFLSHCLVLIRALMTVQRTHWASTSLSKENVSDTQRLLTLLSTGGILPAAPFKHVPTVLSELQAWEVSCILNDICRYLKDSTSGQLNGQSLKPYVERLRIIMAHNIPGPLFVQIFKGIN